jgi:hypothetical protein
MYILSFVRLFGGKYNISFPAKISIIQNDRNHYDYHPGTVVFGLELRLPCYSIYLRKYQREEDVQLFVRITLKLVLRTAVCLLDTAGLESSQTFGFDKK